MVGNDKDSFQLLGNNCLIAYHSERNMLASGGRYEEADFRRALTRLRRISKHPTWEIEWSFTRQFINKRKMMIIAISVMAVLIGEYSTGIAHNHSFQPLHFSKGIGFQPILAVSQSRQHKTYENT